MRIIVRCSFQVCVTWNIIDLCYLFWSVLDRVNHKNDAKHLPEFWRHLILSSLEGGRIPNSLCITIIISFKTLYPVFFSDTSRIGSSLMKFFRYYHRRSSDVVHEDLDRLLMYLQAMGIISCDFHNVVSLITTKRSDFRFWQYDDFLSWL